jgi:hypothetical protein
MPLYEIVLRSEAGDEVRLHSEPPPPGGRSFELGARVWTAGAPEPAEHEQATARYVCVEARERSARLRALAAARLRSSVPMRLPDERA